MKYKRTGPDYRQRNKEAGFTLIELLVVLVILGLIAGLVGPHVMGLLGKAKSDLARVQMENISTSLDLFNLDIGRYPNAAEGLKALIKRPQNTSNWAGPYLQTDAIPVDPWGRVYVYKQPGDSGKPYQLKTLGENGVPGGTGQDSDISKP